VLSPARSRGQLHRLEGRLAGERNLNRWTLGVAIALAVNAIVLLKV
jgi:hypothetical protein